MAVVGTLIAESMQVGSALDRLELLATKITRADVGDMAAGQPRTWTFIEFEAADEAAAQLAGTLERMLEPTGGWYCDFRTDRESFIVFAHRTFRYRRGDEAARAAVVEYARSVGVPEAQLDWPV
jgi:hypothetical protein